MNNKRFRIVQGYSDKFCYDWQNNRIFNFRETVALLNDLYEENGQLKKQIVTKGGFNEDKFRKYRKKAVVVEAYQTDEELEI